MKKVYLGASRDNITPELGTELSGFGYDLERRAEDIHDDLCTVAFFVTDGYEAIGMISNDIIGLDAKSVDVIRDKLAVHNGMRKDKGQSQDEIRADD